MWVKIRNMLVPLIFNDNALRAICGTCGLNDEKSKIVATAIMNIKHYIDTHDRRFINQTIDELQKLI